jgi:hypothetical protein
VERNGFVLLIQTRGSYSELHLCLFHTQGQHLSQHSATWRISHPRKAAWEKLQRFNSGMVRISGYYPTRRAPITANHRTLNSHDLSSRGKPGFCRIGVKVLIAKYGSRPMVNAELQDHYSIILVCSQYAGKRKIWDYCSIWLMLCRTLVCPNSPPLTGNPPCLCAVSCTPTSDRAWRAESLTSPSYPTTILLLIGE